MQKLVFHKLLGFGILTSDDVDFSDATFGAKLGAKVGEPEPAGNNKAIEFSRLLSFGAPRCQRKGNGTSRT